jgi:F-type H+-transporting ATPase subunit b
MAESNHGTTATTEVAHESSFPPFDATSFPSQIFWLVLTFAALFIVLWRMAGPRIQNVIADRRSAINGAIEAANKARADADAATAAYDVALAGARGRANTLAEETRQGINAEIAKAKADAEAQAASSMAAAETRIQSVRNAAKAQVAIAAQGAAAAIVERLTGERVSVDEAAKAVGG